MSLRHFCITGRFAAVMVVAACLSACRSNNAARPRPAASRAPTESTLAGDAATPADTPSASDADGPTAPETPEPLPTMTHRADGVHGEILIVNNEELTVPELLYLIGDRLYDGRDTSTDRGFVSQVELMIRNQARREVGTLLVYQRAMAQLADQQKQMLTGIVEREVHNRIDREFGGSRARFEQHLIDNELSESQYRKLLERALVVQQFLRETLDPKTHVRRDSVLEYYRTHIDDYRKPALRELRTIEAPFDAFLPDGVTWDSAGENTRALARLKSLRQIRAAHEALATRPFDDVAHEFSRGLQAGNGGSWGMIGKPLAKPPYDTISTHAFDLPENGYTEPIETDTGWFIVGCGSIQHASETPFSHVQEDIRKQLEDERFNALAADYIADLAMKAQISAFDEFMIAARTEALARAARSAPATTQRPQ